MKDWFRDNLKLTNKLIGSYDDRKNHYNITLHNDISITNLPVKILGSKKKVGQPFVPQANLQVATSVANQLQVGQIITGSGFAPNTEILNKLNLGGGQWKITISAVPNITGLGNFTTFGSTFAPQCFWNTSIIIVKYDEDKENYTVSFAEKVKGWTSFKSFVPDIGVSMANDYYTFLGGNIWRHHDETVSRNNFYNEDYDSSLTLLLNDAPSSVKDFMTLNYEGTQAKVDKFKVETFPADGFQPQTQYNDQEYYNLIDKDGWYVDYIKTDLEDGYINELLDKEGKWFNYIKKDIDLELLRADTGDFSFQGIGFASNITTTANTVSIQFNNFNNLNTSLQVGDEIYGVDVTDSISNVASDLQAVPVDTGANNRIGVLLDINQNTISNQYTLTIDNSGITNPVQPTNTTFIMFCKAKQGDSSLLGYYAEAKFVNNSKERAELFSVGSEVMINSK